MCSIRPENGLCVTSSILTFALFLRFNCIEGLEGIFLIIDKNLYNFYLHIKHNLMTRNPYKSFNRLLTSLCIIALLVISGSAWSAEVPEHTSSTSLEKFQEFTDRAAELGMQAMGLIGINYKRGGNTPDTGLDCSGFVRYVFKEAWGADLPRTSAEISRMGKPVDSKDLQPGDLVFYNTLRRGFSHVGIYLGDNKFIHAPSSGGQVRIESMTVNYWKKRFNGARRVDDPGKTEENPES